MDVYIWNSVIWSRLGRQKPMENIFVYGTKAITQKEKIYKERKWENPRKSQRIPSCLEIGRRGEEPLTESREGAAGEAGRKQDMQCRVNPDRVSILSEGPTAQ